MARAGVAAEVIFPDFGLPFEKYSPFLAQTLNYSRTREQIDIANQAYNRWLADFCSAAPDRFAAQALMLWDDVDAVIKEIHWAKEAGFRGVLLPMFTEEEPIFDPKFDPIWETLVELQMPANSHVAISGAQAQVPKVLPTAPNTTVGRKIYGAPLFFYCHQLFSHLVWGGVLEKHPDLQVVFTEQGSGWVIGTLTEMDYTWDGSMLKQDLRDVVRRKPSEYFSRQCHLGSSIFSLAEIKARHDIGIDKMTLGMDFPHPEGTWAMGPGHLDYLRATVGVAEVPPHEARLILGENAISLWGFDADTLQPIVDEIGFTMEEILTKPERDFFPRGDVHKPLSSVLAG
jgi:predicted TIM-barrel fold metal-dependent hydrolase